MISFKKHFQNIFFFEIRNGKIKSNFKNLLFMKIYHSFKQKSENFNIFLIICVFQSKKTNIQML